MAIMADLQPSTAHLAYVMGYDTRPLLTLEEKAVFDTALEEWVLFLDTTPMRRRLPSQRRQAERAAPSWSELLG